ncbi:MAG TPA: hypothetical protein DIU00_20130 [Phycisphaerales bacterium]|nr:hypothetical protein [Phycisphaerales bacterium]
MLNNILGFFMPGPLEILIVLIGFAIPVILAVLFFQLLLRNKKDNIRLRLEVGKLADELEQTRKQKGNEEGDSSTES